MYTTTQNVVESGPFSLGRKLDPDSLKYGLFHALYRIALVKFVERGDDLLAVTTTIIDRVLHWQQPENNNGWEELRCALLIDRHNCEVFLLAAEDGPAYDAHVLAHMGAAVVLVSVSKVPAHESRRDREYNFDVFIDTMETHEAWPEWSTLQNWSPRNEEYVPGR